MKFFAALFPLVFAINAFGQILFDESRTFVSESIDWNLHNLAADVFDSSSVGRRLRLRFVFW